jgi:8-oxo-dGTP pyrophosphatase MutT (NUDIX family)
MNDALSPDARPSAATRKPVVRPRDAASLILLRGAGAELEVLVGRRPLAARFMPGVYVFPGGAIDPPDRVPWSVETGTEALAPKLARCARAALRETWEEVGVLVGRPAGPATAPPPPLPTPAPKSSAIEQAYRARGLAAAMDVLTYVGRAITPSFSSRRFNTRFFLADGGSVSGEPTASAELEDVRWHRVGTGDLEDGLRDVTRFMLARAMAMRSGTAAGAPPLFYWGGNARRIGICREGARAP